MIHEGEVPRDRDKLLKKQFQGRLKLRGTADASVQHSLWATWARIAIRHEREAWDARQHQTGSDLTPELEHALISITAVAFALEGFVGAALGLIPDMSPPSRGSRWREVRKLSKAYLRNLWRALRGMRPRGGSVRTRDAANVFEVTKRLTALPGKSSATWLANLEWLFELRGAGVHHIPHFSGGLRHPSVSGLTAEEYSHYSAENAKRAVDLMLDVLESCLRSPRASYQEWASQLVGSLQQLPNLWLDGPSDRTDTEA